MKLCDELEPALAAVSGGAGDIGQAIVKVLKDAGAQVATLDLVDQPESRSDFHGRADITDAPAVEAWFEEVTAHFGAVPNILIPNAAIATPAPHLRVSPEEWKRELDINLNGAFYFAEAGARALVAAGKAGRIVFMGSWAGHAPHATIPAYCAAKAGLRMLMKTLAGALAEHRILVNEIAPGFVNAGLSGRHFEKKPGSLEKARSRVPIGEVLTAEDVARQVLYLCSSLTTQMTGTTLLLDGGLSLMNATG